jgi:hypothetical protein
MITAARCAAAGAVGGGLGQSGWRLFSETAKIGSAIWGKRPNMDIFAGLDVSMEVTRACIVSGKRRAAALF